MFFQCLIRQRHPSFFFIYRDGQYEWQILLYSVLALRWKLEGVTELDGLVKAKGTEMAEVECPARLDRLAGLEALEELDELAGLPRPASQVDPLPACQVHQAR